MFEDGSSVQEVCQDKLQISRKTFYNWLERHEEFAEAYEEGRWRSEAFWARMGRSGAMGAMNVNPALWIFNMKNRFGWRDKLPEDKVGDGELSPEEYARRVQLAMDEMNRADRGGSSE
jgi:hypothetical protein